MSMRDQSHAAPTGLTIRRWLVLLGVGTATLVLLISTAGFVLLESLDSRRTAQRETSMLSVNDALNSDAGVTCPERSTSMSLRSASALASSPPWR